MDKLYYTKVIGLLLHVDNRIPIVIHIVIHTEDIAYHLAYYRASVSGILITQHLCLTS